MPSLGWAVRGAASCCGVIFINDVEYSKVLGMWASPIHAVNVDVVWASLGEGGGAGRDGVSEGMDTDL